MVSMKNEAYITMSSLFKILIIFHTFLWHSSHKLKILLLKMIIMHNIHIYINYKYATVKNYRIEKPKSLQQKATIQYHYKFTGSHRDI